MAKNINGQPISVSFDYQSLNPNFTRDVIDNDSFNTEPYSVDYGHISYNTSNGKHYTYTNVYQNSTSLYWREFEPDTAQNNSYAYANKLKNLSYEYTDYTHTYVRNDVFDDRFAGKYNNIIYSKDGGTGMGQSKFCGFEFYSWDNFGNLGYISFKKTDSTADEEYENVKLCIKDNTGKNSYSINSVNGTYHGGDQIKFYFNDVWINRKTYYATYFLTSKDKKVGHNIYLAGITQGGYYMVNHNQTCVGYPSYVMWFEPNYSYNYTDYSYNTLYADTQLAYSYTLNQIDILEDFTVKAAFDIFNELSDMQTQIEVMSRTQYGSSEHKPGKLYFIYDDNDD